ncbi:MAG: hypothetical protein ACE15F_22000 [bacterium]
MERENWPAVLMRLIVDGNRGGQGALIQAVLMTVFRTWKRRGYNPVSILVLALRESIRTKHVPPFPPVITSEE